VVRRRRAALGERVLGLAAELVAALASKAAANALCRGGAPTPSHSCQGADGERSEEADEVLKRE
jgi:hypothetical protein